MNPIAAKYNDPLTTKFSSARAEVCAAQTSEEVAPHVPPNNRRENAVEPRGISSYGANGTCGSGAEQMIQSGCYGDIEK